MHESRNEPRNCCAKHCTEHTQAELLEIISRKNGAIETLQKENRMMRRGVKHAVQLANKIYFVEGFILGALATAIFVWALIP
jgi:hypothetical protein